MQKHNHKILVNNSNPVLDAGLEAAKHKIDGIEVGIGLFNSLASNMFKKEKDNRAILIIRDAKRNIEKAREELGIE